MCSDDEFDKIIINESDFIISTDRYASTTTRTFEFKVDTETSALANVELTYLWQMGDDTEYNTCCIQHTYAQAGDYEVTLNINSPDDSIQIVRQISAGKKLTDIMFGYNDGELLFKRKFLQRNVQLCVDGGFICQNPEACCTDDDIWSFSEEEIIIYSNSYNDCICLDVNEDPVRDDIIRRVDDYIYGTASSTRSPSFENDSSFIITQDIVFTQQYVVAYNCQYMNQLAQDDLTLTTNATSCGCGFFYFLTNSGQNYIVTYLSKLVDNQVTETMRLELAPGETLNLDCNKICLEDEKDVLIEFNCTDYYTPIF